jgi:hypothetical protein
MSFREKQAQTTYEYAEEVRCCRIGSYYLSSPSFLLWDRGYYDKCHVSLFSTSTRLVWSDAG